MKNKLPKLLAFLAFIFLGGMLYGQAAQSGGQGNTPVVPKFNTEAEKNAWIKEHPQEYQQAQQPATTNGSTMGTTVSQQPAQPVAVEGFPVYVNTGDKAKDDANYSAAKQAWIAAHPEEYAKMNGNQPQ